MMGAPSREVVDGRPWLATEGGEEVSHNGLQQVTKGLSRAAAASASERQINRHITMQREFGYSLFGGL